MKQSASLLKKLIEACFSAQSADLTRRCQRCEVRAWPARDAACVAAAAAAALAPFREGARDRRAAT